MSDRMRAQVRRTCAAIEEFRANEGKVGGQFEGASLILWRSQQRRTCLNLGQLA
jgi:hypothetical protein